MNGMNEPEDLMWQKLLALSAPTFAGDAAPPYGFTTRFLANWRAEARQCELMERIGLRTLFASLGVLAIAGTLAFGFHYLDRSNLEPGLSGIIQIENVPAS